MSPIAEAERLYKRLTGVEMPPEVAKELLAIKVEVGLHDNDSMFVIFVALGYYAQLYKEIPGEIGRVHSKIEEGQQKFLLALDDAGNKFAEQVALASRKAAALAGQQIINDFVNNMEKVKQESIAAIRKDIYSGAQQTTNTFLAEVRQETAQQVGNIKTWTFLVAAVAVVVVLVAGFVTGNKYAHYADARDRTLTISR